MRHLVTVLALLPIVLNLQIANAEQRIALVIGNAAYPDSALRNPVNDANDVGARLADLGFEVVSATDTNLQDMQQAIVRFVERIEKGAVAMVYYAGHGVQANGRNYLLPVDASFESERSLRFEALEVADILEELEKSSSLMNVIVLDACRNNPFERKLRGGGRGLAAVDASAGSLIAYATAPGSVAADGEGRNGLWTAAFLETLAEPGLKIEEVFKQVRIKVAAASDGRQIPWDSSSLTADFVFNPTPGGQAPAEVSLAASTPVGEDSGICNDLSGNWISRNAEMKCDSRFTLTKVGDDTYEMDFKDCNVPIANTVTGTSLYSDSVLTTRWRGISCSGVTTINLSKDCRSGEGSVTVTPFLLCKGTYRESIRFVGAAP